MNDTIDSLNDNETAALRTVCRGFPSKSSPPGVPGLAWSPLGHLKNAGHHPDTIAALVRSGWLVTWDLQEGTQVTLTPWAADQLGVELEEFGLEELPGWQKVEPGRTPRPIRLPWEPKRRTLFDLRLVRDPRPAPGQEEDVLLDPSTGVPMILFGQLIKRAKRKRPSLRATA